MKDWKKIGQHRNTDIHFGNTFIFHFLFLTSLKFSKFSMK